MGRLIFSCIALLSFVIISEAAVARVCFAPNPPLTPFISNQPQKPFCPNGCEQYQIDSYRYDVEQYYKKLERFAEEDNLYHVQAIEWIKCKAKLE